MRVRKAIIPAAGLGTRLRPVTDFIPKELLPIGTKPSIFYVLEETQNSGIEEVILVISKLKKPFFERLEIFFPDLKFHFPIQETALGLGHAVLVGEDFIHEEPFLVLLPDVLMESKVPASQQLMQAFEECGTSVDGSVKTPREKLHLYGVHDIVDSKGKLHRSKGVVEKPKAEEAPSDLSLVGRYLFTPEIFEIQKATPPGKRGEIQLADAMNTLAKKGRLYTYELEGIPFDVGTPEGYLRTLHHFGEKSLEAVSIKK